MKISYTWLKDLIEIEQSAEETAELLTDLGLEVEGLDKFESVKNGLEGVVVGKVLTCKKHPNADRLQLTTVDIGAEKPVQIVCGAPNIAKDQKVAVATVGTTLYNAGEPWKIKKGKIRGEESFGMICSEKELGLGEAEDGILVLNKEEHSALKPGEALSNVYDVLVDQVFEIGLTPNRSDAMSHYGVARDLRAGLAQKEINKQLVSPSVSKFRVDNHTRNIPVIVEDSEKVTRYCGISISDIKVEESPVWLQNRLRAIGLTPRNNIVDATNYVMHELGQPFHAFDADRIRGQKIYVKTVEEGTKFITLDDETIELHKDDIMICDKEKPLCLAGVYGGKVSGVQENTTNIFLESAYFDAVSIRKTAKRHGFNTDASFRYERGIDPNFTDYALKRLVLLIQEIAGGSVSSDLNDFYPKKIEDHQVFLRYQKINSLVGQEINENELKAILSSLDIRVKNLTESGMGLAIPPYRHDVKREVDVIEEILRVYGYNKIGFGKKLNATIAENNPYDDYRVQKVISKQLAGQGFYEIMSNSLTDEDHIEFEENQKANNVEILNPLSHDLQILRQSIIPSGLESIAYNLNRKNKNLRFFEIGKTYHQENKTYKEHKHLCLFITGQQEAENWNSVDRKSDFFYVRGVLQGIFERLGITISFEAANYQLFSEGLALIAAKEKIGSFGVLKKAILKKYSIDQEVLVADLEWEKILDLLKAKPKMKLKPIVKYPAIRRDFALLLDEEISFVEVERLARQTDHKLLKEIGLFDVYQGGNLPKGKKSYAVSFKFLDEKKTLTDKKVDKIMKKLRTKFEEEFGAELR